MGTMRFNFRSQSLSRHVDVTITLPTDELSYYDPSTRPYVGHPFYYRERDQYKPGMKFQTAYFIQGGGDDDTYVYRYTNIERYASIHRLMLVTPNIIQSFGADTNYGVNYQEFLTEELPTVIQTLFPSSPKREDNFIIGYAMGGNVALGTAIMRPDLYSHCIDMSGGIGYTLCTETMIKELKDKEYGGGGTSVNHMYSSTFGRSDDFAGSKHDLMTYVRRHTENGVEWPKFTVICGSDEFIRPRVEGDVAAMKEWNIPVEYICPEGHNHDFRLWDEYGKIAFDEILPLKNAPIYTR